MLAAISTNTPREIIFHKKALPNLKVDEVLIKVSYCGVCGSDLHALNHAQGYEFVQRPRILGHEIVGEVVQVKDKSNSDMLGQHVIIESMHYCGKCYNCQKNRFSICIDNKVIGLHFDGGMAEYVKTKVKYLKKINDLEEEVAVLSEPMAIAVHAIERAGNIMEDDVILVQGAGIIGFFVALLCVEKGATVYISGLEKDYENRLSKFNSFGMIPHIVEDGLVSKKVDFIFECSGSNLAVLNSFQQLKKGGIAVFVALYEQKTNIFFTELVRNEWSIITSYGCNPVDYELALSVLKKYSSTLKELVTYYSFDSINEAINDGLNQRVLKPVISMKK
ncbi:alcohol dehydrogenase catalytic domain-containing protein [Pseudogracilibacillus sp. SE30717A]|uniref:zinc-dependent alcohol dehydrogenase n=1 Tax=Pseudogracilibacillus sp. SE30717A TaxID=3098293 RepID=UPI00300E2436